MVKPQSKWDRRFEMAIRYAFTLCALMFAVLLFRGDHVGKISSASGWPTWLVSVAVVVIAATALIALFVGLRTRHGMITTQGSAVGLMLFRHEDGLIAGVFLFLLLLAVDIWLSLQARSNSPSPSKIES